MAQTILYTCPRFRMFSVGSLVVTECSAAPELADIDHVEASYQKAIEASGKISAMMVIAAGESKVDGPTRARIGEMTKRIDGSLACFATVVLVEGHCLMGRVLRTFILLINLLARSKAPTKVFGSLAEAAAWIEKLPGQPQSMRAQLEEATAALTLGRVA